MTEPRYQIAKCPHCGEELSIWPVAPDGADLDVETLVEAMDESWGVDDVFIDDVAGLWRPFAIKVAGEYKRLRGG